MANGPSCSPVASTETVVADGALPILFDCPQEFGGYREMRLNFLGKKWMCVWVICLLVLWSVLDKIVCVWSE